ncbi:undecaprenyl pyrophosphate phosphatase [Candidatus Methylomirabilis lanthanidiphila]|uniref:Undecaprenyl pyrophosphate phosphatase n=1 Tax=Candidatus Methylomirabilis lanthanidiphila TaxID=2211376 RepID=A0A564ZFP8_9BACT|nr:phosphatase PAP2 family protein [Candidatus Methylomirabilis lanthanidiphila]VUZ84135.1 undecaprenyl pyrophosphate phosphatase [Candidatus Methylomirabilis lanthanidiphila]
MLRSQNYQTPSGSLAQSSDRKVLGYITASLVVLPFLIWYIDGSVKGFILSVQSEWGLRVATAITAMGYGLADAAIAGMLLVIGLKAGRPREALAGRLGLFAVVVSSLSGQLFKHLFCRARPLTEKSGQFFSEFPCLGKGAGFISFPSGHAVTAFALAFVLARAYPRYMLLFYGLAGLVALSRVYLAKHFPSDVVAGAAVGILAGWIVCRFAAFSPVHGHT